MGAIFGFSGWSGKKSRAMADALSHRGTPPARTHASIRSTACWLPARSNHGGIIEHRGQVIALAGRLYTDQQKTHMAPLLRSYREKGLDFVRDLQGAYVLSILDEDRIHLARDPSGLRTIYYGLYNDRFIFAVEPKGVLAWTGFARDLRPAAVAQYLSFGFVPGMETMLENLWELPPGHTVTFAQGRIEPPSCFTSFHQIKKEEQNEQAWEAELVSLHGQALADQLPNGETIGLFLSGGLGSSVIGAELLRKGEQHIPSWSIGFEDEPKGLEQAKKIAHHIGTEHQEILIRPKDFLENLDKVILAADEPPGDPSAVLMYMLSEKVAEDVRYILTGTGNTLAFGGRHMLPVLLRHWYGGLEHGPFFREQAYLSSCNGAYSLVPTLLTPEWRSLYNTHDALEGLLTPFLQPGPGSFLDKLSATNILLKGGHMQLPLIERMTGAHRLTSLAPLFDERLLSLSFRMPSILKINQGREKILLRRAYSSLLPQNALEHSAPSLAFPARFWQRKECKKYARKILSRRSLKQAGIFHPERINDLLSLPTEQIQPQHDQILWLLLTFELWRRKILNEKT
ncbi:MAG: asparagine synthase-related protein [Candidatus Electrothrix scaldis]|nr:MAG: asparagine synthase-related protein [Candidatus Electrothrix sp. GW3-3]